MNRIGGGKRKEDARALGGGAECVRAQYAEGGVQPCERTGEPATNAQQANHGIVPAIHLKNA